MITKVKCFQEYARTWSLNDKMFEKCVGDMEQGVLHVDTVDCPGMTLGVILWCTSANQVLWDRYWALSPDAACFGNLFSFFVSMQCFPTSPLSQASGYATHPHLLGCRKKCANAFGTL
jgi:hypothetical protein